MLGLDRLIARILRADSAGEWDVLSSLKGSKNLKEKTVGGNGSIALIGLDWGTSSLRGYSIGCNGVVQDERKLPLGIMHVGRSEKVQGRREAFESALKEACGDWLLAAPDAPILACGMVGSAQGWREAPYLNTPVCLDLLDRELTSISMEDGRVVYVVPGLKQVTEPVNMMRGEETQLVGCMASISLKDLCSTAVIGLPGTHSKWVILNERCVQHCETFMTGEVFEALCKHTILGRTMGGYEEKPAAFDLGVKTAIRNSSRGSVLSTIFTSRSLGLTGALAANEQPAYLSGLLIGEEVAAVQRIFAEQLQSTAIGEVVLYLAGDDKLCRQYLRALKLLGRNADILSSATPRGLWEIAIRAKLVSSAMIQAGSTC